jgi:transcriptional regulator with XRE-family HTH domain
MVHENDDGKEISALKTLRELLGHISQEELARRLGVTVGTVSRWERGISPATFTVAQMKAFIGLLKSVGRDVENLPDELNEPLKEFTLTEKSN